MNRNLRVSRETDFAREIAEKCLTDKASDPRLEWSYKTAALYGFGILTTLGYGKVEPRTANGRIFTVIYGFIGIPLTVILLTNLGRYLEVLAQNIKKFCLRVPREEFGLSCSVSCGGSQYDQADELPSILPYPRIFSILVSQLTTTYITLVTCGMCVLGATFIPLLNGQFDFFNGIYFAFICLTAIEYGDLVPDNDWYIPVVIAYVCIGLAISTIALVIQLFLLFSLEVRELITAVGQNIGIGDNIMADIDIETLVKVDGQFPLFVDSEDDLFDIRPKKTVVRFEDEVTSDIDDTITSEAMNLHSSRLSPIPYQVPPHLQEWYKYKAASKQLSPPLLEATSLVTHTESNRSH
uniref:Ion_trans_2 domain-containing protein n=1 Tax=Heterorhabditis bacteriophora TaxID=37862 RepID=A0A1I7XFR3_HETBA